MSGEARRAQILEYLCDRETASVEELARRFGVSRMTVHRDLDRLAEMRCVRKVRGGVTVLPSVVFESNFSFRERRQQAEKRALARRIAELVEPGMTLVLDDSTTTRALAEFLPERKPVTVITNAAGLVNTLIRQEEIVVICLGGRYDPVTDAFLGLACELAMERLRADLGVFSTAAVHGGAAYLHDSELVRAKLAMKSAVDRSLLAFDHTKFGKSALHLFARLDEFDRVFTTEGADPQLVEALSAAGVALELVPLAESGELRRRSA